jgi:hypothetical protein
MKTLINDLRRFVQVVSKNKHKAFNRNMVLKCLKFKKNIFIETGGTKDCILRRSIYFAIPFALIFKAIIVP